MSAQRPRILLVEDDAMVSQALALVLEGEGMDVVFAASAEDGWEQLKRSVFDLLIIDKNLPGRSGIELLRDVRRTNITLRTVMITAFASSQAALETLHLGVDGFLEKPFDDIFAVAEKIKAILAKPARARARITTGRAAGHFNRALKVLQAAQLAHESPEVGLRVVVANAAVSEREWLRAELAAPGDEVVTVRSLQEASDLLQVSPPDVLIVDASFGLPALSQLLLGLSERHAAMVLFVTAERPDVSTVVRLIDLGVRAVIDKPLESRSFHLKVDTLFAAAREGKSDLRRRDS